MMEVLNTKMDVSGLPPSALKSRPNNNHNNSGGYSTTNGNHHHRLAKPDEPHNSSHSVSPGSMSGRSSSSSLNNAAASTTPAKSLKKDICVSFRKVSINETPKSAASKSSQQQNGTPSSPHPNMSNPSIISSVSSRTSLIKVSAEKKAKKVRFFINGDKFFKGATIAVSSEKFRTLDKLLEHLTRIMCNQVTLPNGVRHIFALDSKPIDAVDELLHGGNYVSSSNSQFRKLDYLKLAQDQGESWNRIKRETCYLGVGASKLCNFKRESYKMAGHSKSFGVAKIQPEFQMKPKIIAVLRSGLRPRKAVRVLLNNRNTKSFENLLGDLTNTVKLDTGAVRKVFTLDGKPVMALPDFTEAEVFIAYGVDKCSNEDFDLDMIEFRNVQSILKSPELDAKYEKFSSAAPSPKTSRRKFLSSRHPAKRKRKTSSSSKSRESPRTCSSATTLDSLGSNAGEQYSAPSEVANKYHVGDIIGDGNFAVVRKCTSRKTGHDFALKIIDKSKCQGKEHMIESEIAILTLVSHSGIIELLEVFDFHDEKHLVTEYVRGGDLFDAIAVDTKYTEKVSRRMVADLVAALKYLHDKMIVHRDIKPENLLVVNLDNDGEAKSLKLGDFGLAQLVSEPLFTVCGTPTYVAPEILAETGYGVKVDVWATGVIMYILLVGYPPFSSRTNNQEELFDQILSGLFEFNSPDWDNMSYSAKELISWMLQVDPLQRYSAYEILQHPWILKGK